MPAALVKDLGNTSNKVAGTTLAHTFTGATAAGNLIVARVLFDNFTTASKPIVSSISKMAGETANWVLLGAARSTSTTAGAFASGELWCIQTTVNWSAAAYTVTLDSSVTMKAIAFEEWSGVTATLRSTVGTAYSTTTTQAQATSTGTTPVIGDLALGFMFTSNAATIASSDADTTGGSWSTATFVGSTGSSAATNNFGLCQYKVLTAASHQTYNTTGAVTAGNGSIVAILQALPEPSITQAVYQFFDDAGTESGAASLAAVNTSVTGNVSNGDGFGVLRIRLQSTTAIAVAATDDFQLQWEKNASGTWTNVTTSGTTVQGFNNPNLTDGAATTNRLGAGTGSFVAGEVSETGLVTDLGWAANNYTEVVYSLRLLAANLVNADTLRFRVLRNGATSVMTYSVTPTISIIRRDPLTTLTDAFTSTVDKVTKWPFSSAQTVWDASGRAKVPCASAYYTLSSSGTYVLTGSSILVRAYPATPSGTRETMLQISPSGGNELTIFTSGTALRCRKLVASVTTDLASVTYNATAHAWWRIRESGGTVYFDYSADSSTWTNLDSTTVPWSLSGVAVNLLSGYYGTESAADTYFDNVNVPMSVGTAAISHAWATAAAGTKPADAAITLPDTFDRASLGAEYVTSSALTDWQIVSSTVRAIAIYETDWLLWANPVGADVDVSGSFDVDGTVNQGASNLIARSTSNVSLKDGVAAQLLGGTWTAPADHLWLRLISIDNDAESVLGTYDLGVLAAPLTTKTITLRCAGDQLSVLYDGAVVIGPVTHSTYQTNTYAGFRIYDGDHPGQHRLREFNAQIPVPTSVPIVRTFFDGADGSSWQSLPNLTGYYSTNFGFINRDPGQVSPTGTVEVRGGLGFVRCPPGSDVYIFQPNVPEMKPSLLTYYAAIEIVDIGVDGYMSLRPHYGVGPDARIYLNSTTMTMGSGSGTRPSLVAGDIMHVGLRCKGDATQFELYVWKNNDTPPTTPNVTCTQGSPGDSGEFATAMFGPAEWVCKFHRFYLDNSPTAPWQVPDGSVFTDDFAGTGPLNPLYWTTGGFQTASRVSGEFASNGDYGFACLTGDLMGPGGQYAEVTKLTTNSSVQLGLSSTDTTWQYPSPTNGYFILSRNDGVAEAYTRGASLGYSFITAAPVGTRIRAEHDGAGNLSLFHDGVLIRTWDDPGVTQTGPHVWLNISPDIARVDNFEAGDLGGATPSPKTGTAAVAWRSTVAATGPVVPKAGTAAVTYTSTAAATGKETPKATAATTYTSAPAAAGKRTPRATSPVTYTESVTTAGARTPKATSAVTYTDTLTTSGKRTPKGATTTPHTWVTAASGVAPAVGVKQGTATVTWSSTTAAAGKRTPKALTTVGYTETTAATGKKIQGGSATVSWSETSTAAGKRTPKGATAVTSTDTITAAGSRTPKALTTTTDTWALAASGLAPTLGVKQGSAAVTYSSTVTAAGKKVPKGGTPATYSFTLTSAGKRIQKGTAAPTWSEAVTAAVGKRTPKTALVAVTYTEAPTAAGKKAPKGAGSTIAYAFATAAAGVKPIVGLNGGYALVTYNSTVIAAGRRAPKGAASTTHTWSAVAQGKKIMSGTGAVQYRTFLVAAGKQRPSGLVVVTWTETTTAAGFRLAKARADASYQVTPVALGISGIAGLVEGMWNGQEVVGMQYGSKPVIDWLLVPA